GDGEIEYLGRLDDQIKIRGFRVELGEIAAKLSAYPGIDDAAVVPLRRDDDETLAAYYVAAADSTVDPNSLRRHLQQLLPPYLVPAFFVALPRLPLTANGKLDRQALPDPIAVPDVPPSMRAPRTALEMQIMTVWRNLLGRDALGPDDNVFDHGAHSMLAVRARNRLRTLLGRDIPVVWLFQCPTPATLAAALSQSAKEEQNSLARTAQERAAHRRQVDRQAAQRRAVRRHEQ